MRQKHAENPVEAKFLQQFINAGNAAARNKVLEQYRQAIIEANRPAAFRDALIGGGLLGAGLTGLGVLAKTLSRGHQKNIAYSTPPVIDVYLPRYSELVDKELLEDAAKASKEKKRKKTATWPFTYNVEVHGIQASRPLVEEFYNKTKDSTIQQLARPILPATFVNIMRDPVSTAAAIGLFGGGILAGRVMSDKVVKGVREQLRRRRMQKAQQEFEQALQEVADIEVADKQKKKKASSPLDTDTVETVRNCVKLAEIGFGALVPLIGVPLTLSALAVGYSTSPAHRKRKALEYAEIRSNQLREQMAPTYFSARVKLPPEISEYIAEKMKQKQKSKKTTKRLKRPDLVRLADKKPVSEKKEDVLEQIPLSASDIDPSFL